VGVPRIWGSRPVWRYKLYKLYLFHDCRSFYRVFKVSNQVPRHYTQAHFLRCRCCQHGIVNDKVALDLQGDLNCRNGTAFSSWRADR
jgi:hypothetical protein